MPPVYLLRLFTRVNAYNNSLAFFLPSLPVYLHSYKSFTEEDLVGKFLSYSMKSFSNSLMIHQV